MTNLSNEQAVLEKKSEIRASNSLRKIQRTGREKGFECWKRDLVNGSIPEVKEQHYVFLQK